MGFGGVAGEMGVDFDVDEVAHHQQRRVVQRQRIIHELLERSLEVLARPLVFPRETTALPHIRPALPALDFGAALKAVVFRVARLFYPQQVAQIVEMLLRSGALGDVLALPVCDEGLRRHVTPVFSGACASRIPRSLAGWGQ